MNDWKRRKTHERGDPQTQAPKVRPAEGTRRQRKMSTPRPDTKPAGRAGAIDQQIREARRDERERIAALFDDLYPEWAATIRAMGVGDK